MFYEAAEKRLEITTKSSLFNLSDLFWKEMVNQASATILSTMKTEHIHAYLLSESSLFIWKNKLLLITCGETHLINSALYFLDHVNKKNLISLVFQRHQTLRPDKQISNFIDDCTILNQHLSGEIKVLQKGYSGDLYQYGERPLLHATQQIFMLHQLKSDFSKQLQKGGLTAQWINHQLALKHYFPQFKIDGFSFDPQGYSVNAIADEHYFTLHITPEKLSTYLSFESNLKTALLSNFFTFLDKLFKPQKNFLFLFS